VVTLEGTEHRPSASKAADLDDIDESSDSLNMKPMVVAIRDNTRTGQGDEFSNTIGFCWGCLRYGQLSFRTEDTDACHERGDQALTC
jgi:hypothetical protein